MAEATVIPSSAELVIPNAKSKSQRQVVWEQFSKHQLAVFGGIILLAMYFGALFAPFISPYGLSEYSTSDITKFHPPTQVYFLDPETNLPSLPFVYKTKRDVNLESFVTEFKEDRTQGKFYVKLFVSRPEQPYNLFGVIPMNVRLFGVDEPARVFLLGADSYGRDKIGRAHV